MASAQEVLKRGYLTKSPPQRQALAKWKRRWCMLCDSRLVYPCAPPYVRLEYYEDETAALACKEPKGAVDLLSDKVKIETNSSFTSRSHKHVFDIITTGRVYHMSADSAPEKHEWVEALRGVVNRDDDAAMYRSHIFNTRQASQPHLHTPPPQTRPETTQLRRPKDKPVTNRQRPISFGERERQQPTISDNQYYSPASVVPRPPAQQQSIAERLRSMSVNSAIKKREQLKKSGSVEVQSKGNSDYDEAVPRPPGPDYEIPEAHQNFDSDDEEDTKGPVSIRPSKSGSARDNDSDSEEDTAGPTSIVSRVSPERSDETISRKVILNDHPFARKRFSQGFDSNIQDYQNVDYSGKPKLGVHPEEVPRAASECYQSLPSHQHLAMRAASDSYSPSQARRVAPTDSGDYQMAVPHHTSVASSKRRANDPYDYVQPGARIAPSAPGQPMAASASPRAPQNQGRDYDYVQPNPRPASAKDLPSSSQRQYRVTNPSQLDGEYELIGAEKKPEVDGDYDVVGARVSQH